MLFAVLGGMLLQSGLWFALDTVIWKRETGENFIEYGIKYATMRHQFYNAEVMLGVLAAVIGLVFMVIGLRKIKKSKK